MSHSPQAVLPGPPVTPPRAPLTPPHSDSPRCLDFHSPQLVTQVNEVATESPTPATTIVETESTSLSGSSPAFFPTCASSPDSGSTSLSSASNSSSASSISFVLSAPSWPSKLDASTSHRSSSAVSVPVSQSSPAPPLSQHQDPATTSNLSVSLSGFHSPLASPINNSKSSIQHDTSGEFDPHNEPKSYEQPSHDEIYGVDNLLSALSNERHPQNVDAPIESKQTLPATLSPSGLPAQHQLNVQGVGGSHSRLSPQARSPIPDHPSPQLPPAPTQQTIPLPEIDFEPQTQASFQPIQQYHDQNSRQNQQEGFFRSHVDGQQVQQGNSPGEDQHSQTHAAESALPSGPSIARGVSNAPGQAALDKTLKTPNVYVNGLPPHFPEDQLYALAAPFGGVRSVRTFTRHVRDSESGYGFVLFETVEAAERCITSLRRYRNLHPTFSKQIHKIPGTQYAQLQHYEDSDIGLSSSGWKMDSPESNDASFKAKLESLQDPTSTNLYIEGLPLSIDEPTLAALVSPHRISSSRFFQTRLSNPPRIIAFVRLETRAGAEEVIERLHGRMVRGWNDPGCRISVRFADTTEQRELRRAERMSREGDQMPARLTLAQAALLNLHGQDLRSKNGSVLQSQRPLIGRGSGVNLPQIDLRYSGNQLSLQYPDTDFTVDYSRAPPHQGMGIGLANSQPPTPTSATRNTSFSNFHDPITLPAQNLDPAMAALLSTLRSSTSFQNQLQSTLVAPTIQEIYRQQQEAGTITLPEPTFVSNYNDAHHVQLPQQVAYTAAEEVILRAHANSQVQQQQQQKRRPPPPLDIINRRRGSVVEASAANISIGLRGHRAHASTIQISQPQQHAQQVYHQQSCPEGVSKTHRSAPMTEAEFHASGDEFIYHTQAMLDERNKTSHTNGQHGAANRPAQSAGSAPTPSHSQNNLRVQGHLPLVNNQQQPVISPSSSQYAPKYQIAHLRSTTLPTKVSGVQSHHQYTRHVHHNSLSITPSKFTSHASIAPNSTRGGGDGVAAELTHEQPKGNNFAMNQVLNGAGNASVSAYGDNPQQTHHQRQHTHSHYHNQASHSREERHQPQTHARPGSLSHGQRHRDITPPGLGNARHSGSKPNANGNTHEHSNFNIPANGGGGNVSRTQAAGRGSNGRDGGVYENPAQAQFERANYVRRTAGVGANHSHGHSAGGTNNGQGAHAYEFDASSPSIVSPALTYSSQSPSTMSPATPFFGSFANHGEGFASTAGHGMSPLSKASITGISSPKVNSHTATPSIGAIGGGVPKTSGSPHAGSAAGVVGMHGKNQQGGGHVLGGGNGRGQTTVLAVSEANGSGNAHTAPGGGN